MATKIDNKKESDIEEVIDLTSIYKELEELKKRLKLTESNSPSKEQNLFKNPLLVGKKVYIVPIKKTGNNFIHDADQATMLRGTGRSIMCPINGRDGRIVDPLESWERVYLEKELRFNLNVNSVDVHNQLDCFYTKPESRLKFKKKGKTLESATVLLDLGNAFDYLLYKICKVSPRVAKNWEDRKNPSYDFVIKDIDAELMEEIDYNKKEDKVIEYVLSIRSNKKALFDLLRLYGNDTTSKAKVTIDNSIDFIYNEIKKVTKSIKGVRLLFDIINLVDISPKKLQMMIFIEDALSCGSLEKHGSEYRMPGGNILGYSNMEVIKFLELPENQSIKMKIAKEIENFLNTKK